MLILLVKKHLKYCNNWFFLHCYIVVLNLFYCYSRIHNEQLNFGIHKETEINYVHATVAVSTSYPRPSKKETGRGVSPAHIGEYT